MPSKTFATRRYWHNVLLVIWAAPFLLLIGVLVLALYGSFAALFIGGGILLIGSLIALLRDISDRPHYTIKSDRVILENSRSKKVIPIMDVIDASLVDRMVAREYIRQRTAPITARQERRERMKELMRFCSVDIGLTSLTFGLGRSVTDRLPMARYDLVLLRTKSGDHLLSPRYDQDLVETVSRMISSRTTN